MSTAKLFRNGNSQAVRLPKELALPGHEVYARRCGRGVLLLPMEDPWSSVEAALAQFSPDFMADRDQPPAQVRETL